MTHTPKIIVESVVPLTTEQTAELRSMLKRKFGSESFTAELNAELLGGLRITVGSTQYDASVLNKLAQLRNA